MKVKSLSKSSFETYDHCQWKYFLNYDLKKDDGESPSGALGHIAHKILELVSMYLKGDVCLLVDGEEYKEHSLNKAQYSHLVGKMWESIYEEYKENKPELEKRFPKSKAKKIYKALEDIVDTPVTPLTHKTIDVENRFRLEIDGVRIGGIIDRVDELDENSIEIIDYKSGGREKLFSSKRKKQNETDLINDVQAEMYFLACDYLYPEYDNILVTIFYLIDGGMVSIPFSKNDLPRIIKRVSDKTKEIEENEDPQKHVGWWCKKMCEYGKNGLCRSAWKDKEKYGINFVRNKYS